MNETNLDNLKPKRKAMPSDAIIGGAAVGTPLAILIPFFAAKIGIDLPLEVAGAIGALVTAIVSYFPRGGRQD